MTTSGGDFIHIRNVSKWFGEHQVLTDVNLGVAKGEIVSIIGPSGSGKSTLLRCINRIEDYQEGTIRVDGIDMNGSMHGSRFVVDTRQQTAMKRRVTGMVFQRFNLFNHLTALDNVALAPRKVLKMPKREAYELAERLLARVKLQDHMHKRPRALSGGQQQRIAIARAIAMGPSVMLFDEPTSALDPELVGEVLDVIRDLATQGLTMMIVTHEMKFAREISGRVLLMSEGQIVEVGDARSFFEAPQHERTRQFLANFKAEGRS